jgi:hypothetical protein
MGTVFAQTLKRGSQFVRIGAGRLGWGRVNMLGLQDNSIGCGLRFVDRLLTTAMKSACA